MDFFKDLPHQLLNNSNAAHKRYQAYLSDASHSADDAELFAKLTQQLTVSDAVYQEHGRATHLMLKSAFDSFQ